MSLDLIRQIMLPEEVSKEEIERYFSPVVGKPGAYLPTKAYLDALFEADENEEKWRDWHTKHQISVKEKRNTGGAEPANTRYVLSDSCSFTSDAMSLDPRAVSKLFPSVKIEMRQSLDGEWEQSSDFIDGEQVGETRFLWTEEERARFESGLRKDKEERAMTEKVACKTKDAAITDVDPQE